MGTVIRALASGPKRGHKSAANKESKESEVAWRDRQAKLSVFARQTLVIPSEAEAETQTAWPGSPSRRITENSSTGSFDPIRLAWDEGLDHAATAHPCLSAILCTTLCRRK